MYCSNAWLRKRPKPGRHLPLQGIVGSRGERISTHFLELSDIIAGTEGAVTRALKHQDTNSCTCAKIFGKLRHMASLTAFSLDGFSKVSRATPLSIVRCNTCLTPCFDSVLRHDLMPAVHRQSRQGPSPRENRPTSMMYSPYASTRPQSGSSSAQARLKRSGFG